MNTDKYLKIRKTQSRFIYEILDDDDETSQENLIHAGKRLGVWDGEGLLFDSEDETNVLMDYLLHEKNGAGSRLVDRYKAKNHKLSKLKQSILKGMTQNIDSLFEVLDVDESAATLTLSDVLEEREFVLTDIGFSQTAIPGILLYTRLLPVDGIHITSGLFFGFHPEDRIELLEAISIDGHLPDNSQSQARQNRKPLIETMFHCNRLFGIDILQIEH